MPLGWEHSAFCKPIIFVHVLLQCSRMTDKSLFSVDLDAFYSPVFGVANAFISMIHDVLMMALPHADHR